MLRWLAILALVACDRTPTEPNQPSQPSQSSQPQPAPSGYAGRPIAPAMSHLGAPWLERPEREDREQPERVLDALALTPHMVVADVGAGSGYFTARLARRVARVYATDVQPEMLALIAKRNLPNVTLVQATERDAKLPARSIDLALLVDVYHELADPPAVMRGIRAALKPGGRLVLVEYRGEDAALAIKPEHKMTLAQIRRELEAQAFEFVESLEFLPDQRIVIFR